MRFLIEGEYHLDPGENATSALSALGNEVAQMDGVTKVVVSIVGNFGVTKQVDEWDLSWKYGND